MKSGLRMVLMSRDRRYDPTPQRIGYDDGERYEDDYGRRSRYDGRVDRIRDYMPPVYDRYDDEDEYEQPSRYRRDQREQERIKWQREQDKKRMLERQRASQTYQNEDAAAPTREQHTPRMTMETAEEWVECMQPADPRAPEGGKWSAAEVKPFAIQLGIPQGGSKFAEFYAMMNAMYSDYCEVAKKYGVDQTDFYADMAKAWMNDKDAKKNKTALYYECIVQKDT